MYRFQDSQRVILYFRGSWLFLVKATFRIYWRGIYHSGQMNSMEVIQCFPGYKNKVHKIN